MTVTASYEIDAKRIEEMPLSITVTMTTGEWRTFMREVPAGGYECHHVGAAIATALGDVTRATSRKYTYPSSKE